MTLTSDKALSILVLLIALLSGLAATLGIWSDAGPGSYDYTSIRGNLIEIYGKGIYRHMSADVAIQGIAQDYITLFIAIPLLIYSRLAYSSSSLQAAFTLTGTLGYFLVTYLFYMTMGMYNALFLVYTALLGLCFFAFIIMIQKLHAQDLKSIFSSRLPVRLVGWFLIFNATAIAILWLGIVVPPLLHGTIYPPELKHYTTLIVQGFDLGLLLPLCFVSGILLLLRKASGYLYATVYLIFLSILMSALTAKIIAMALHDVNVVPVVFIIPTINLATIACAILMLRSINKDALLK